MYSWGREITPLAILPPWEFHALLGVGALPGGPLLGPSVHRYGTLGLNSWGVLLEPRDRSHLGWESQAAVGLSAPTGQCAPLQFGAVS